MAKIVSIHSFRGGTGKSNTTANVAAVLADRGLRVGVVDTDIQSPGIHVLFGLTGESITHSLNDFLWGKCPIHEAARDVTDAIGGKVSGKILLIPSSMKPGEITRVLREGYDSQLLAKGYRSLIRELELDVLLIDTHPGLNEETLLSIVLSSALAVILRPDRQDYEGTGVTVQVARKLEVPRLLLVVNKVPAVFDMDEVRSRVERTFECEVGAVFPHSEEMMVLASSGLFVSKYPDHPITSLYKDLAERLIA